MTAKQARSTKELLKIEQAVALWDTVKIYAEAHYQQLAAAGLVVCILAAGLFLWKGQRAREEGDAAALLAGALARMSRSEAEPADGALQYKQALETFSEISKTHSGTRAAATALLYAGNCSFRLGDFDEAISAYEMFLKKADRHLAYLKPYAYEGLGYAYEEKGDYAGAIAWFERQRSAAPSGLQSFAALNLARCFEASGDRAQACASYRQCRDQLQLAAFEELVTVKIAELCAPQGT